MGRTKRAMGERLKRLSALVRRKRRLVTSALTDLDKKRATRGLSATQAPPTQAQRARKLFGVVHAIVMGLVEECHQSTMFIVEDVQRMTVLPAPDVAFALRDLVSAGLIKRTPVPALYSLAPLLSTSTE